MDHATLAAIWFALIALLLGIYVVLDGFDLGVGILHPLVRDERRRALHLAAVGPLWDGNEVWLITGGGALFAAFPLIYGTVFSAFYTALMLVLWALIFRALAIEFHHQLDHPGWRRACDWGFALGSLLTVALLGVAMGNVLHGLPIKADGSVRMRVHDLFNPPSLLWGLAAVVLLAGHGAGFLAARLEGRDADDMARWAGRLWWGALPLTLLALGLSAAAAPALTVGLTAKAGFWLAAVVFLASAITVRVLLALRRRVWAFCASSAMILALVALFAVALYPRMLPSTVDPAYALTVTDGANTAYSLGVMLVVVVLGLPLVIAYFVITYRIFLRGPVSVETYR